MDLVVNQEEDNMKMILHIKNIKTFSDIVVLVGALLSEDSEKKVLRQG